MTATPPNLSLDLDARERTANAVLRHGRTVSPDCIRLGALDLIARHDYAGKWVTLWVRTHLVYAHDRRPIRTRTAPHLLGTWHPGESVYEATVARCGAFRLG